jgi:hypothetical protein
MTRNTDELRGSADKFRANSERANIGADLDPNDSEDRP